MGSTVQLFDDLDDNIREDVETVQFAYGNETYAIDLGIENRVEFDQLMQKYIEKARPATPSTPRRRPAAAADPEERAPRGPQKKAPSAVTARNARIRAWARENNFDVLEGGRLKNDIIREYEAANPNDVITD